MLDSNNPLSQYVFVVFADDWGRHPSSCQHLFRRIIPRAQVIWVNTIGLRTPRINVHDFLRGMQVLRSWMRPNPKLRAKSTASSARHAPGTHCGLSADDSAIPYVLNPVMWPSFQGPTSSALNNRLVAAAVHRALRHLAPGKLPILVSTSPTLPGLFRDLSFRRTVYYCVDDFTHWHGVNGRAVHRLEQETLNACDLMIATSTSILESRSPLVSAATLLTHGVDLAHFSRAKPDPASPLAQLAHPLVGMFGVFDQRVDGEALKAAALLSPQATFVVIGPVDRDPAEFRELPNILFLGPVPYAELPGHVAHLDLCILPYVMDESTRNINPLKLKEYLATGKPVITSPLPEAVLLAEYLTLAGPEEFPVAVASALAALKLRAPANPVRLRSSLENFLRNESWEAKAKRFLSDIMEGL